MRPESAVVLDGVNYGDRLPRGRHGIPQEQVLQNQRDRLLAAAVEAFTEHGYAALTVGHMVQRAGVSRATFYKLFDQKLDCVLAAQRQVLEDLRESVAAACSSSDGWPSSVIAATDAALSFAAQHPNEARLLLACSQPLSEPALACGGLATKEWLLELLRNVSTESPGSRTTDPLGEEAAVGAAMSIVSTCLAAGKPTALGKFKGQVVQITLMPYLDSNEAKHDAQAA